MSDAEIEQKREEDERLDTAEDPNEEVRYNSHRRAWDTLWRDDTIKSCARIQSLVMKGSMLTAQYRKKSQQ